MEGKSSTQSGAFYLRLLANCLGNAQILNLKIFHNQIAANLLWNATEIVRFLKKKQNLGFFSEKKCLFLEKELEFFQNK